MMHRLKQEGVGGVRVDRAENDDEKVTYKFPKVCSSYCFGRRCMQKEKSNSTLSKYCSPGIVDLPAG